MMYPRKEVITASINVHYVKGEGEIINIKKISDYTGMKQYTDTYLAKYIATRRSVYCIIREHNKVAFLWKANKQCGVSNSTNEVETRAFFEGIKRTKLCRKFFESLAIPITHSTQHRRLTMIQYNRYRQID